MASLMLLFPGRIWHLPAPTACHRLEQLVLDWLAVMVLSHVTRVECMHCHEGAPWNDCSLQSLAMLHLPLNALAKARCCHHADFAFHFKTERWLWLTAQAYGNQRTNRSSLTDSRLNVVFVVSATKSQQPVDRVRRGYSPMSLPMRMRPVSSEQC